jgi:hypothetical protein
MSKFLNSSHILQAESFYVFFYEFFNIQYSVRNDVFETPSKDYVDGLCFVTVFNNIVSTCSSCTVYSFT